VSFAIGDFVYLKLYPYRMKSLGIRVNHKLGARFYGPFEVLERIGKVAYKLKLLESAKIHPVFHVSLLKKSIDPSMLPQPLPTELNEETELIDEPEFILESLYNKGGEEEVLVLSFISMHCCFTCFWIWVVFLLLYSPFIFFI